jgi:DNA modification methylase
MTNLSIVRQRTRTLVAPSSDSVGEMPCNKFHDNIKLNCLYIDPARLLPPARALRKYSKRQTAVLKASVSEYGFIRPILTDGDYRIIAGHGAWLAAKELGLAEVPIVIAEHLTPEQARLYAMMDNRSAELSTWDDDLLRLELGDLLHLDLSGVLDLNIELSGFATAEIDKRLHVDFGEDKDKIPDVEPVPITVVGDIYSLGNHKLVCADALDDESYVRLMGDERAQMVTADAPFNVKISGNVSGQGKKRHREFAMASGEMSQEEFITFLTTAFTHLATHSIDGSIHFQFMDWRHVEEIMAAGRAAYTELKNLCVWTKDNAGMGSFYRSQHELVFVWKSGKAGHINNFGLGDTGRWRSNVWPYAGCNSFSKDRDEALASHPTVKPLSLVADAIRDCSKRGGIILDPFGGSGTTLIAAEITGRRARLIELDPLYCDVIIRRWQKRTGKAAIHLETGLTFDELADERGIPSSDGEA